MPVGTPPVALEVRITLSSCRGFGCHDPPNCPSVLVCVCVCVHMPTNERMNHQATSSGAPKWSENAAGSFRETLKCAEKLRNFKRAGHLWIYLSLSLSLSIYLSIYLWRCWTRTQFLQLITPARHPKNTTATRARRRACRPSCSSMTSRRRLRHGLLLVELQPAKRVPTPVCHR